MKGITAANMERAGMSIAGEFLTASFPRYSSAAASQD